jgi:phage shock protein A
MNDDAGTGGRWMTYDELAAMRGIKRIGAVRLVQRYKWRRQAGNDGRARVLVPHDALQPVRGTDAGTNAPIHVTPTSAGSAAGNDAGTMLEGALAALEDAVAALREQLDVANARAERAESAITTERAKSDALRQQLVRADARSDELRTEAAALHERVEALQAGQDMMLDMHARALAAAQSDLDMARAQATTAHDALKAVRQAQADRKGRDLLARLRAAWRGE